MEMNMTFIITSKSLISFLILLQLNSENSQRRVLKSLDKTETNFELVSIKLTCHYMKVYNILGTNWTVKD